MSLEIFWFLPTSGDTRYLGKSNSGRPVTIDYMQQIAVTADNPNGASVRFLIDCDALPEDSSAYERLVLVFNGEDDEALQAARGVWTAAKSNGFDVTYWQPDEQGRWQRKN